MFFFYRYSLVPQIDKPLRLQYSNRQYYPDIYVLILKYGMEETYLFVLNFRDAHRKSNFIVRHYPSYLLTPIKSCKLFLSNLELGTVVYAFDIYFLNPLILFLRGVGLMQLLQANKD